MPRQSKKDRLALQQQELQLWQTWKADPNDENLAELIRSLDSLITKKVNEFKAAPVPPGAVRGIAQAMTLKAIQTYDPDKGAALGTHVFTNLKKVRDFVGRYQNLGRIPIHRIGKISEFQDAVDLADVNAQQSPLEVFRDMADALLTRYPDAKCVI